MKVSNNEKSVIINPLRMISLITIFAGISALVFEVSYFAEFSVSLYCSRLIATTVGFLILIGTYTEYGRKYPVFLIHILLLSITLSFGTIIFLIPDTLFINSHLLALTIFTTALFLSWDTKNQIIVAIYYNIIFAASILYNDNTIYFLPNIYSTVLFVLLISILSVSATAINSRLREKLNESSEQAKEIFNNSIEGIFRISETGEIDSANNTFFSILDEFNISLDSQRKFPDILLGKNSIGDIILEVNNNGYVKDRVNEVKQNADNIKYLSLNLRPSIICKKSDVKHYDGSILDVTSRMQAELQQTETLLKLHDAKQKQEKKSQEALELKDSKILLLAKINHELKTPINSISIFLHLILSDQMKKEEELKSFAASAIKSTELMLDTLNKYLDFTKIEAGKLELEQELFNFRELISDCISLLLPFSEFKNLDLMSDIAADVPNLLFGDENHYKQILLNFANNAIKFTRNGYVKISITKGKVFQNNFEIITKISDTGRGIPEDKMSSLFIPYQQINSKTDSKYGTGLGLIICQELVKLLGGEIKVESKPDEGSVFSFSSLFQLVENNDDD
ncbi:MAG: hypothetical protein KKF62_04620 [Bacteroidetes bacterium]|nr:hypothetical protein [Bacteroidota bacterium]MBU1116403.1 hypothetical protein [Bacteroidota bacterium]MBU1796860.1 hypothetical protein [Bacteroidota bacterium]